MSTLEAVRVKDDLSDPGARGWEHIEGVGVELGAAALADQPSRYIRTAWATRPYGLARTLIARAAHDGERLFLRLSWPSPTLAQSEREKLAGAVEGPDAFPDACAVVLAGSAQAQLGRWGSAETPVRVWRWAAGVPGGVAERVEDLVGEGIAEGAERLRPAPDRGGVAFGVQARAGCSGERREVVFSRALTAQDGPAPGLEPGSVSVLGFALWVGANQERSGIRSVSKAPCELAVAA